jgi:20S proteasome subunit alpha 6
VDPLLRAWRRSRGEPEEGPQEEQPAAQEGAVEGAGQGAGTTGEGAPPAEHAAGEDVTMGE